MSYGDWAQYRRRLKERRGRGKANLCGVSCVDCYLEGDLSLIDCRGCVAAGIELQAFLSGSRHRQATWSTGVTKASVERAMNAR